MDSCTENKPGLEHLTKGPDSKYFSFAGTGAECSDPAVCYRERTVETMHTNVKRVHRQRGQHQKAEWQQEPSWLNRDRRTGRSECPIQTQVSTFSF